MAKKIDPKILQAEIIVKIREFYPYFLGFYLLSLIISLFSKTWSGFFYWPGFHGIIIFFTLLFVLTFKLNFKNKNFKIIGFTKNSAFQVNRQLRQYFNFVRSKLLSLPLRTWLKIFIISAILIFALFKTIGVLDFLILLYALISFFFILDSRYAAGTALFFLASCPFLLIFKKDALAESVAIYAYYFLIITVLTQIRELKKAKKNLKSG
jgi:hypothetical protein